MLPAWIRWIARTLLPPATPQLEERESIWSISRKDARTFFRLVSLLWLAAIIYLCRQAAQDPMAEWNAAAAAPGTPWHQYAGDFIIAVLRELNLIAIGIAIIAMLLTRPLNIAGELLMTLYQAMVNRFVMPVIEAHKDAGRAEGRATERAEWEQWLKRRTEAEARGQPFDEPPPSQRP